MDSTHHDHACITPTTGFILSAGCVRRRDRERVCRLDEILPVARSISEVMEADVASFRHAKSVTPQSLGLKI